MSTHPIRVLHVDDEPGFADMVSEFLEREDNRLSVKTATSADEGLAMIAEAHYDCIVSDYEMPGTNGLEFLTAVRNHDSDLPFIVFTGKGSEELASDAISAGVTDYLQKEGGTAQYALLTHRITNAVSTYQSQQEIKSSQERLSLFFEQSPLGAVEWDEDFDIVRANTTAEEILGYEAGDLEGRSWRALIPDTHEDEVVNAFDDLLNGTDAIDRTDPTLRADGEQLICEWHHRAVENESGDVATMFSKFQDVTERVEREAELKFVRDLLDRTERIADVGGWEIDPETESVFWTDHLFDMLGVDYEEAPPLGEALDVYLEADRPKVEAAVEAAIASRESFDVEARFETGDDSLRWFRIQGEPALEDDEMVAIRGAVQDITAHKDREQELEQAREGFIELFNGMNDTAWILDADGEILAVNDAAVETLGYTRQELHGTCIHEIDSGLRDEDISALIREMPEDEIQVVETVHTTKDGRKIPVEISSSLVLHEGQTAILSVGRDISARKQRERQLEEFASVVSHDLRNPLNVAQGNLALALEECKSEHLANVAQAHDRMERLIADLLELAHEGEQVSDLVVVDLAGLVETCWANVDTAGATLETEGTLRLRADRNRLQQFLENLIRNAVEHGGEGVTVWVGPTPMGFYVADDGPGIPAAKRDAVFEMGYTTSGEGTGFGLSIANRIAEAHGWTLTVTESDAGGARFEVGGVDTIE